MCIGIGVVPASGGYLFDGQTANAWLIQGQTGIILDQFNLTTNQWSRLASQKSPSVLEITLENGAQVDVPDLDLNNQLLLINNTAAGFPLFSGAIPSLSLAGLDEQAAEGVPAANLPRAGISPAAGTYDRTVEIRLFGIPARNSDPSADPVRLIWKIGNGSEQSVQPAMDGDGTFSHCFYLVENGDYTIRYRVEQAGVVTNEVSVVYRIANTDSTRDTDEDGIPDIWEIAGNHRMNPLKKNDLTLDSDGDGWSDFDELLRGSDPLDSDSVPLDTDMDGWSDFDETLRGTSPHDPVPGLYKDSDQDSWSDYAELNASPPTDPHDGASMPPGTAPDIPDRIPESLLELYADRPVAQGLYGVEYLVRGEIYSDAAATTRHLQTGHLAAVDSSTWKVLYSQDALNTDMQLLTDACLLPETGNQCPVITEADLPARLRPGLVADKLALGELPSQGTPLLGIVRLPADRSVTLRTVDLNEPRWVVRHWLRGNQDITPHGLAAWLAARGETWNTAQQWETRYKEYLAAELVKPLALQITPATTLAVSWMDSALGWAGGFAGTKALAVLANEDFKALSGGESLARLLEQRDDSAEGLFQDYLDFFAASPTAYSSTAFGYFNNLDPNEQDPAKIATTVPAEIGGDLQHDQTGYTEVRYRLWLIARTGLTVINGLTPPLRLSLLTPASDTDMDGLSNYDELLVQPLGTDPLDPDSDDDGYNDGIDPCPLDYNNLCMNAPMYEQDIDGDGWPDFLDNCRETANPNQKDSDSDGIGDMCEYFAVITTPVSDQVIFKGATVEFKSATTPFATGRTLQYHWDTQGGANLDISQVESPSPGVLTFSIAGSYQVQMEVTDTGTNQTLVDRRTVHVLDIPVAVDSDSDGWADNLDNCPQVANPGQDDYDGDGRGDLCDNCIAKANTDQFDLDGDGMGNACDPDDDNDGVPDNQDAFPNDPGEWADTDNDGVGDNSDNCPGVANPGQEDNNGYEDGTGKGDACENWKKHHFYIIRGSRGGAVIVL
jgi:hypothetical protein